MSRHARSSVVALPRSEQFLREGARRFDDVRSGRRQVTCLPIPPRTRALGGSLSVASSKTSRRS